MGQQDTLFSVPSSSLLVCGLGCVTVSSMNVALAEVPVVWTVSNPQRTMMVSCHPSSLDNSNKCLILQALAADFGTVIILDFCGLVQ